MLILSTSKANSGTTFNVRGTTIANIPSYKTTGCTAMLQG